MILSSSRLQGYRVGIAAGVVLLLATLFPQPGLAAPASLAIAMAGSPTSQAVAPPCEVAASLIVDQDGAPGDPLLAAGTWQMRARDLARVEDAAASPSVVGALFVSQHVATCPDQSDQSVLHPDLRQRAALARFQALATRLPARRLTGLHAMRAQAPPARA